MIDDEVMAYLRQRPVLHVDMTEPLRMGTGRVVAARKDGVLVEYNGSLMLTAESTEAALALCGAVPDVFYICAHQQAYVPALMERYDLEVELNCVQVARFSTAPIPYEGDVEVRPIGAEWLDFVEEHYEVDVGRKYLAGRFAEGVMVGAFIGGEIAGFAGEHDEGTLGMLEVLPQFRRRGVGRAIGACMANRRIAQGRVPFGQVLPDNAVSLAMQRALGYEVESTVMSWLKKRGMDPESL